MIERQITKCSRSIQTLIFIAIPTASSPRPRATAPSSWREGGFPQVRPLHQRAGPGGEPGRRQPARSPDAE